MSSIMEQIKPEHPELFACKILKEFNYECNQDRIVRVNCPLFKKTVTFEFVYTLLSAYIDHLAPNLGKIFMSN